MELFKDGRYKVTTTLLQGIMVVKNGKIVETSSEWKSEKNKRFDIFYSTKLTHYIKTKYLGKT